MTENESEPDLGCLPWTPRRAGPLETSEKGKMASLGRYFFGGGRRLRPRATPPTGLSKAPRRGASIAPRRI